jgi:EAL domain-containing protein (putative c-di-GMP-specific phosphodiesterase class I)
MLKEPANMTLVSTIVSMGQSLKLKVVAEGVDLEEQAQELAQLRCDQMQGYLFGSAIPIDEMAALLRADRSAMIAQKLT